MNKIRIERNIKNEIIKIYLENKTPLKEILKKFNVTCYTFYKMLEGENVGLKRRTVEHRKYTYDKNFFKKINDEKSAYWLGFLYADGCVSDIRKEVSLRIKRDDVGHIEKFKKDINSNAPIYLTEPSKRIIVGIDSQCSGTAGINIGGSEILDDMIKLGCTPRKSLTVKFPSEQQVPSNLIPHFVRGYFDGDGHFSHFKNKGSKRENYKWGLCGTLDFIINIQKIFQEKLGIKPTKIDNRGKYYVINYAGNKIVTKIINYIYNEAETFLERKYKISQKILEQGYHEIGRGVEHYLSKNYAFYSKTTKSVLRIRNLREFCRKNKNYCRATLRKLHVGIIKEYKDLVYLEDSTI